jgi:hypothetical protein
VKTAGLLPLCFLFLFVWGNLSRSHASGRNKKQVKLRKCMEIHFVLAPRRGGNFKSGVQNDDKLLGKWAGISGDLK